MIHVLWSLLNISLLLCFLYVCYKATRLLRQQFGLPASLIFIIGFICFTIHPPLEAITQKTRTQFPKVWEFSTQNEVVADLIFQKKISLINEGWGLVTQGITIVLGENKVHQVVPIRASYWKRGLWYGLDWVPEHIGIEQKRSNRIAYSVRATMEWRLLGLTLYTEAKAYHGEISTWSVFK